MTTNCIMGKVKTLQVQCRQDKTCRQQFFLKYKNNKTKQSYYKINTIDLFDYTNMIRMLPQSLSYVTFGLVYEHLSRVMKASSWLYSCSIKNNGKNIHTYGVTK